MKKAMLFFAALLFSVSAHAAVLDLSAAGTSPGVTQNVGVPTGSTVIANGVVNPASPNWSSSFDLTSSADTQVVVEWKFNPSSALIGATLAFVNSVTLDETLYNITGDFVFTAFVAAGVTYWVDIFNASSSILAYDLSISAVPIPAALWLFAPALLGFCGMRRRAAKVAAA